MNQSLFEVVANLLLLTAQSVVPSLQDSVIHQLPAAGAAEVTHQERVMPTRSARVSLTEPYYSFRRDRRTTKEAS